MKTGGAPRSGASLRCAIHGKARRSGRLGGSTMNSTMSAARITPRISFPRPLPSAAPLIRPGRSKSGFRTAVLHDAGDARQRREGVRTGLRMRVGDLGDERGFSDRWETDQGHHGIARLADLEALARTGSPEAAAFSCLSLRYGDLGLQLPNVGVCGLVFLGLMDRRERLNLLLDRRLRRPRPMVRESGFNLTLGTGPRARLETREACARRHGPRVGAPSR